MLPLHLKQPALGLIDFLWICFSQLPNTAINGLGMKVGKSFFYRALELTCTKPPRMILEELERVLVYLVRNGFELFHELIVASDVYNRDTMQL